MVGGVAALAGEFAGVEFRFSDIGVSFEPGPNEDQLSIQIPQLQLQDVLSTPIELGRLGIGLTPEQVNTLEALNPSGQLNSVMAIVRFGDTLDYRVVSQLEAVKVERYLALPIISDLNGLIRLPRVAAF